MAGFYKDTIAAVSTAVSEAGIGIIRISGEEAFSVIDRIYQSKGKKKCLSEEPSHTIHYGFIYDGEELIDEVLVMLMRSPRSFTAEDTVEINCHGGVYAVKRVLETVLKHGARAAQPGEFTKRAFLNGRIDLSQAEAVIDVIQAKNEYALQSSVSQLKGSVRRVLSGLRQEILYFIARLEAALDDPEHISLEGYGENLEEKIIEWKEKLEQLLASSDNGRILKEGINTVIAGKPNAGKSSLLNILVGEERAIVTSVAGTTRDTLTETINRNGITLNLTDTAGIRETGDLVEQIGVEKARKNLEEADLVIYVADSSTKLDENDEEIIQRIRNKKAIILLNKSDLEAVTTEEELQEKVENARIISVSARTEEGIADFEAALKEMFYQGEISFNDEIFITNIRQKELLKSAYESLCQTEASIQADMPEDFFSIDLTNAYDELGLILGEKAGEDVINEIFSKFCMGK